MAHTHHHDHSAKDTRNILLAFWLNAGFAILEMIGGYFTGSVAIYSDALHDFGDSLSLLFAYFAERLSHKKANANFNFGYRRLSVMAALVNGLILLLGSAYVIKESIVRLQNPTPVNPGGMLLLAAFGLAVNMLGAYRLSKNTGLNSKILMYHLLEDMFGWIAVLVVSIVLHFRPWFILDSILSIIIASIIIKGVLSHLYNVGEILLQKFPEKIKRGSIIEGISSYELVKDIHFVQGWSIDDSKFNVTLHIRVSPETQVQQLDILRAKIEKYLQQHGVLYSTIQFESNDCKLLIAD